MEVYEVKFYFIMLLIFFSSMHNVAFAKNELPEGYSEWYHEDPCDAECKTSNRSVTHIVQHIWLFRRGNKICGFVEEAYAPRGRVASGRIAGYKKGSNKFVFNFTDDFSHDGQFGLAEFEIENEKLSVNEIKQTDGFLGFASGVPYSFKKIKKNSYFKKQRIDLDVISCNRKIDHVIDFLKDEK